MIKFFSYGHKNILATHKTTLEFTKDKMLSMEGDCIIGVNSDFDLKLLKEFLKKNKKINVKIKVDDDAEGFSCEANPDFNDEHELVIRKTDFNSKRTFGVKADKAAADIDRKIVQKLREDGKRIEVELCGSS